MQHEGKIVKTCRKCHQRGHLKKNCTQKHTDFQNTFTPLEDRQGLRDLALKLAKHVIHSEPSENFELPKKKKKKKKILSIEQMNFEMNFEMDTSERQKAEKLHAQKIQEEQKIYARIQQLNYTNQDAEYKPRPSLKQIMEEEMGPKQQKLSPGKIHKNEMTVMPLQRQSTSIFR